LIADKPIPLDAAVSRIQELHSSTQSFAQNRAFGCSPKIGTHTVNCHSDSKPPAHAKNSRDGDDFPREFGR
jgi:hypothetical protein